MDVIACDTDIARTPAEVFDYIADARHLPEWQSGVEEAAAEPPGQSAVGMRGHERRRTPAGVQTIRWEVTEFRPGERLVVEGTDGPVRAHTDISLTPVGAGTRVGYRIWFEGHGVGKILAPMATRGARKDVPESLARLKENLERVGA